ncbi:MAG: nuclear transport factor 2 family protein [Desulfobulbaceae bacterium]|nr:nuclear transport factor 2 family protein [Desulfobulbaceae bacterium]
MKSLLGSIIALINIVLLTSCAPIQVSEKDLVLDSSPDAQEVLEETMAYYGKFIKLDAKNISNFYAKDAFIYTSKRYTPESFEKGKSAIFQRFKKVGRSCRFDVQSVEVLGDGVIVKSLHKIVGKRPRQFLRWIKWRKIDGNWKIVTHTSYPPKYITEEDLQAKDKIM